MSKMIKRISKDPTIAMDLDQGILKGLTLTAPREVNAPTYEVIGPVLPVDERDHIHSRMGIRSGSRRYKEYYSRHTEKKRIDDEIRQRISQAALKAYELDPVNEGIAEAGFYGAMALSRPEMTDLYIKHETIRISPRLPENPEPRKIDVDPDQMARKIKALGLYMGASKVRIARLNPIWVASHNIAGKPPDLDYRYIICMAFLQSPDMMRTHTARAANLEVGFRYSYSSFISFIMANYIKHLGWPARSLPTFNAPLLIVPAYVDAGIGEQGRTGHVVAKEFGNNFRPATVVTDLPLSVDKPVDFGLQDFCAKCKICADRCPPGAIPKGDKVKVRGIRRFQINPEKCLSYWGAIGGSCGICQSVCPFSHPNNLFHRCVREAAEKIPWLRRLLIFGEKVTYKNKPRADPRWLTDEI
jgi:ferredoxin